MSAIEKHKHIQNREAFEIKLKVSCNRGTIDAFYVLAWLDSLFSILALWKKTGLCLPSNSQEEKSKSLGNLFREEAIILKSEKSNVNSFLDYQLRAGQRREWTQVRTLVLEVWPFSNRINLNREFVRNVSYQAPHSSQWIRN